MSVIDTSAFREEFKLTPDGKFGYYKEMPCEVCGKLTNQHDADMLWDGIPTPLCSDECASKYWSKISTQCNIHEPDDPLIDVVSRLYSEGRYGITTHGRVLPHFRRLASPT